MWLSRQRKARRAAPALAGPVTLEGEAPAAYLDGERRGLPVYAPGGYHWRPALGQELLVLKDDAGRPCAIAARDGGDEGQEPGEVCLSAARGGAGIRLRNDGGVELTGKIVINGRPLDELLAERGPQ